MNEWSLLSAKQEKIVAYYAKITQLEQANKPKRKTKEDNKSKGKEKDNKNNDRNWKKEKPTGKEKRENNHSYKIVGKKTYYWCLHHNDEQGQWVQHQPDECCNKPNKEEVKDTRFLARLFGR